MERNYITHFFQPQHYETRNQLQKEKWKKNKHVGTKKMFCYKTNVNNEIKQDIRKYLKTNKNENTL